MQKPKRKRVSLEQYDLHQARAAVLLPLAVSIEMMISMGLVVGIVTGAAGAPLTSIAMLGFTLFGLWMAWHIYTYVSILRQMNVVIHHQQVEAARIQRLIDQPTEFAANRPHEVRQVQRLQS